jgi:hypothetical protein
MLALMFALGGAAIHLLDQSFAENLPSDSRRRTLEVLAILVTTVVVAVAAYRLHLWKWKVDLPGMNWIDVNGIAQLLLWFTWPAWPLVLWTWWRWRHQLFGRHINRHVALPTWFVLVTASTALATGRSDRTLLLCLPAMATLAAFSLPTLKRQVAALIDWFTLLFFSSCGVIIWIVWIAMQTGVPSQPAANVARLAPGFSATFSLFAFTVAMVASLSWAWLVRWRVGRHRAAIWKSLVLPSGGAALCWLLLMTLWLPALNYGQSYTTMVQRTVAQLDVPGCAETKGLSPGQIAALQVYGHLTLKVAAEPSVCPWLLAESGPDVTISDEVDLVQWSLYAVVRHPVDGTETVMVFKRKRFERGAML